MRSVSKRETLETVEILGARMLAVRRAKCFPDRLPNTVFEFGVRRGGYWRAGFVSHGNLRDRVAPCAILGVAKSGMVRIELHERVAIPDCRRRWP